MPDAPRYLTPELHVPVSTYPIGARKFPKVRVEFEVEEEAFAPASAGTLRPPEASRTSSEIARGTPGGRSGIPLNQFEAEFIKELNLVPLPQDFTP